MRSTRENMNSLHVEIKVESQEGSNVETAHSTVHFNLEVSDLQFCLNVALMAIEAKHTAERIQQESRKFQNGNASTNPRK